MKTIVSGHQGVCPICGGDCLTYKEVQDCDTGICYPWTCDDCGASGMERYSISFDNHYDIKLTH